MISYRQADLLDAVKLDLDKPKVAVEMHVEIIEDGRNYKILFGFKTINNPNIAADIKHQLVRLDYTPQQWSSVLDTIDHIAYVEQSGWTSKRAAANSALEFANDKIKTLRGVTDAFVSFPRRSILVME